MSLLNSDFEDSVISCYSSLSEAKEHNRGLALGVCLQRFKDAGSEPIKLENMTAELYKIAMICSISDKELADFLNVTVEELVYSREKFGVYKDSKNVVFNTTKLSKDVYKYFFSHINDKEVGGSD